MRSKMLAQYRVGAELAHIVALPQERAVFVPHYGRKVFIAEHGAVQEIGLASLATIECNPHDRLDEHFHRGAAFPYQHGFGIIYADVIHLWEHLHADPTTIPIANPLEGDWAGRTIEPLAASKVPGRNGLVVLLNDYGAVNIGRFLARLTFDDNTAEWQDRPHDLSCADFKHVYPYNPHWYRPKDWPVIESIWAKSEAITLIHSTTRHFRCGVLGTMYSAIAAVDTTWKSIPRQPTELGVSAFASDGESLIIQHLRHGKPTLSFYDEQGQCLDTFTLTPKRRGGVSMLGLFAFARHGNVLWLGDEDGNATCCNLLP